MAYSKHTKTVGKGYDRASRELGKCVDDTTPLQPIEPVLEAENDITEDTDIDLHLESDTKLLEYVEDEGLESKKHGKDISGTGILFTNIGYIYESLVRGVPKSRICTTLGVSRTTWYYLERHSSRFKELIERAELEQIEDVKHSLLKKTQDRYVKAEKVLPNGRVVEYNKFQPSDMNAIKFFLLNKAGDEFKDKQEVEVRQTVVNVGIVEDFEDATVIDADTTDNTGTKGSAGDDD